VQVGDTISAGDMIGFVSEPTKYYVVEGSNLYFEMTKAGVPVDPLDYIR
jgi:septal ring factor EnvC (AmiA/AmiB activator)